MTIMDSVHSKPDDFHQATPGVGADGKNIMKLIVGSQISQPASNSRMSGKLSGQLQVTAQPLAVTGGQSLQLPPDAQAPTFSASELLLGIKKEISVSSANTSPSSKPHLKLIPKVSQRPNSPIKWVIEEEESSTTPTPDPVKSSVISEILRVVAERENAKKHGDDCSKPVPGLSQEKSGQEQEDPMAKCKGKCFFVAENGSRPSQMRKSASPTAARKSSDFNETITPLSKQSLELASPGKRPALRSLTPGESDEVIVLKDEDAYSDSSQQAAFVHTAAVTHTEKDKVFVSCIPLKSESRQDLRLKTQMSLVKETDRMGTTSWGFSASPTECIKTGDFHRAMPGVGADGKNIMKLTVGSQIGQPNTDPPPQKTVTINAASAPDGMVKKAAMNPSATQQIVRKQISLMSALPNPGGLFPGNSLNKHPLQQQQVKSETTEPVMVTPAANSRMSGRLSGQLPVTAQPLAVPGGQSLQLPPNAQAPTFPASELLLGMESSGSASVVPVSPTTTVSPVVTPQSNSALQFFKLLCKTSDETLCGPPSTGSKPHLKLIPKASQRPNSPIKWVIEEEESSTPPTPDPVKSSVISEILRVVAERENAKKHGDDCSKPVPGLSREKSGHEQEDPMAKCKGKCFFVAENGSRPSQMRKSASPTAARKSSDFNETITPLSKQSLELASPGKRPALRSLTPGESDEVIVLKDEDVYIDSSQQAAFVHTAAVTHTEKDKVLVSCIPLKSESRQDLRLKTQMALVKETDRMGTTSWGFSASQTECIKTGDFHWATPGVGADGKNIMKLIVGSQISQPKTDPPPQKAVTINAASAPDGMVKKAAMNPSATQQIVRKQIPLMSALPNPGGLFPGNSLNKHPLQQQQQQVKSETTEPLMVTPASNSRMSGRLSGQLPVTAQPLAVPGGQSLQLPPNAQAPTFPASELLLGMESSGSASVVPVSPTTTVSPVVTPQSNSALQFFKLLCKTSDETLCGPPSTGSNPHLKLIPKVSQRPNSPIKWVIEEEESSTPPTPDPVKSSVISEILRVVAERENAKKHGDEFSKPAPGLSRVRVRITPKSESTQDLRLKSQRPLVEETDQMGKSHSNCVTEYKSLGGKTFDLRRRKAGFNTSVSKVQNRVVIGSAVMNRSSQKEEGIHKIQRSMRPTKMWTSSLAPESCQMADNLLRQIFGITANVNICLQRIDGASAGSLPAQPLKSESMSPVETHVDPACRLDLSSPQEADGCNDLINVKRVKVKMEQELSEDFTPPYPHTDTGPFKCSHFEQKKLHSGNAPCDVKNEPVTSYMEPIDEDLISTHKSYIPNSQDTAPGPPSQTFADLNTNARRMDRKRKRTMCPCCASGTQDPAAKSGEPEKSAWMTKHKGKKGRRAKTVSKQGKTSERINRLTAKTKHSCKSCEVPASDRLSTSSTGCNEEIKRLKELLKEKEAALEMLRNTMS